MFTSSIPVSSAVACLDSSLTALTEIYMSYINTYLERDIQQLSNVGKLNEFSSFLTYVAARTAQELNYADIANAIGITTPTVKAWISILQRSGVIALLEPYHNNISNRLVKRPKLYFMDTGLATYLSRWQCPQTLEAGAMNGAFLETYVVTEIMKSYMHTGEKAHLHYYRDIDKKEIDLLIIEENRFYPIEIKKAKHPRYAVKNFYALQRFGLEVQSGLIMCLCDDLLPANRNNWYCPISVV